MPGCGHADWRCDLLDGSSLRYGRRHGARPDRSRNRRPSPPLLLAVCLQRRRSRACGQGTWLGEPRLVCSPQRGRAVPDLAFRASDGQARPPTTNMASPGRFLTTAGGFTNRRPSRCELRAGWMLRSAGLVRRLPRADHGWLRSRRLRYFPAALSPGLRRLSHRAAHVQC